MTVETLTLIQGADKFELPTEQGNWVLVRGQGYSPVQMIVSAVAACGGYVYQSVLENSHVTFTFEKIEVDYTRDSARRAEPLDSIQLRFYVQVPEEQHEKAIRCLRLVSPNCPVIQSLDPTIKVEETAVFI